MPLGTFQYGRNTTYAIESLNTGVDRPPYSAPTTTFIVSTSRPPS